MRFLSSFTHLPRIYLEPELHQLHVSTSPPEPEPLTTSSNNPQNKPTKNKNNKSTKMTSNNPLPTNSALALSLLTSLGGAIGYAKTGSIPSIAAGLSVGAIYMFSFARLRAGQSYGEELGLLASAVLGGSSIPRVIKTGGKPVPLGLSVLATYGAVVFGLAMRERNAL